MKVEVFVVDKPDFKPRWSISLKEKGFPGEIELYVNPAVAANREELMKLYRSALERWRGMFWGAVKSRMRVHRYLIKLSKNKKQRKFFIKKQIVP